MIKPNNKVSNESTKERINLLSLITYSLLLSFFLFYSLYDYDKKNWKSDPRKLCGPIADNSTLNGKIVKLIVENNNDFI